MKRVLLLVLLIAVSMLTIGFSQSVYAQNLSDFESAYNLASEKLDQLDLSYELLDGIVEEDRFYLFEGKNKGYLIYDRIVGIYIEYSKDDVSPFDETQGEKIYVGPTYYYERTEGKYFDTRFGIELEPTEIESLKIMNSNLKSSMLEKKQMSKVLDKEIQLNDHFDNHIHSVNEDHEIGVTSTPPTSSNAIPYSFYYENLRFNMGNNVDGTCSFVAAGMILSYYDTVYDDDIIPEQFDALGTRRISNNNASSIYKFTSWMDIEPTTFNQSPGVTNDFHLRTIAEMNVGNSMSIGEVGELISNYLDDANIQYSHHELNWFNGIFVNKANWVKEGIDSGNPVYIHITGQDTSLDSRDINHAVVGYEYDETGIFVNFGWRGTHTRANIHNYTIENAVYFQLNDTHSTIFNYEWESTSGADGVMCICGINNCYHEITIYPVSDNQHFIGCTFCGNDNFYVDHSFSYGVCTVCNYSHVNHTLGTTWYGNETSHYRKCTKCNVNVYCSIVATVTSYNENNHIYTCSNGYIKSSPHTYNSNKDCTVCGHHATHVHSYTSYYTVSSSRQHRAHCACGDYVLRAHIGFAPIDPNEPTYCYHCGYEMSGGGIIYISNKKNYFEEEILKEGYIN